MKLKEKELAINLRKEGLSLNEIQRQLGVAKSSVSVWVRDVELSLQAKKRIKTKLTAGQLVAQEAHRKRTALKIEKVDLEAQRILKGILLTKSQKTLLCSIMYWCEGVKLDEIVAFTNSDPKLVIAFLKLFRGAFSLDERKFRVCMHLHHYHDANAQMAFWSKVTGVPEAQFIKPYQKPNTGKRYREGYPGCIQVRYHDRKVARMLLALARNALEKLGT